MSRTQYHIVRISVEKVNQILRFHFLLPAHYGRCTGFMAKVVERFPYAKDVRFGLLGLEFNGKRELLLNTDVVYRPQLGGLDNVQPLNIPLIPNLPVTGYYAEDKNAVSHQTDAGGLLVPYTLALYFKMTYESEACTKR